ncbi:hypothetical protein MYAM1_002841 [Malassezia yamatoensis]|uniref:Complex 1 LYR protein domain-containing protein n=1 Tax=Malassezia yamatoensis TaxID=253288 RepID=A0AAJ6CHP8_9BASI|nr:hypothetical protein MYAM1_002841 [Malassezia yamatoensis]
MTAAPTRQQLLTLYRQHLSASRSFTAYNFREYFLRRTRDQFRAHLFPESSEEAKNMQSSAAALSNVATSKQDISSPVQPVSKDSIAEFYSKARDELKVLQRAAIVNMMYSSDRLVVEDAQQRDWIVRAGPEGAGADKQE